MALSLTSTAANMVISLGYHRHATILADDKVERETKIFLFWMVYVFDTSFSVRLGRAPVIRDSDITVPLVLHGAVPKEFESVFRYWIELGRVQCEAVERLYSPAALQQPFAKRAKRAARLEARLQEAWEGRIDVGIAIVIGGGTAADHLYRHTSRWRWSDLTGKTHGVTCSRSPTR